MDRRTFLRLAAATGGTAVLAGFGAGAFAQTGAKPIARSALRDGAFQLFGAGGNVLLVLGNGAAALVDSGAPEDAEALVQAVAEITNGAPVQQLFNTHWHPEHTGGNDRFATAGTTIVAHENTRLWMSTEHHVDWQERTYRPREPAALPNETFRSHVPQPIRIDVGGEPIEYGWLREAHTDGDIYVRFPRLNVIAAGGALAVGAYPVLDYTTGGWIGGLEDATRKLVELGDADTLYIPHEGPAQPIAHVEAQLRMVATVRKRIEDLMRKGRNAQEMVDAGVTAEFDAQWGTNRDRFVSNVYDGLWYFGRLLDSL